MTGRPSALAAPEWIVGGQSAIIPCQVSCVSQATGEAWLSSAREMTHKDSLGEAGARSVHPCRHTVRAVQTPPYAGTTIPCPRMGRSPRQRPVPSTSSAGGGARPEHQ